MSSGSKKINNKNKSLSKKENYFYIRFRETMQTIRKDKKMLQKDFLMKSGLSDKAISNIETAHSRVNAFDYELIQNILDFDFRDYIDDLFVETPNDSKKAELIHLILKLSEKEASTLLRVAHALFTIKEGEDE